MDLTTLLVASLVFIVVYLWFRRHDPALPPCPRRPLPVVGHLLYMAGDTRLLFQEWGKQCGEIYSLYLGGTLVVVLNGYELIKEALVKKADVFSDRPPFFLDKATGIEDRGLVFSNGHIWKEQRSVALSILRTFGMGKNLMAVKIEEEVGKYLAYLASHKGKPTDIHIQTNISTSNVICSILIGHRFEYDDQDFQQLIHKLGSIANELENVGLVNFMPWLRYLPGDLFKAKKLEACVLGILAMLKKFINTKQRHMEDSDEVSNLIDAYFIERNKKMQAGISTTLDDQSLIRMMFDLFGAGTETTSTTISWCIMYMLHYPNIQDKVYNEITDKIGTHRTPTIQDKTQLNYLNAVIMEVQRLASIVPLSVTHMCSEEVTLRGYTIPKGTSIIPNLDSVLHDKVTWGNDAMNFRPERFIDDEGNLQIPEQHIPFSIGRRVCLGEALAKMELFLFLSSMFQRFQFLPSDPGAVPSLNSYKCGAVVAPKPYQVRIVERQ